MSTYYPILNTPKTLGGIDIRIGIVFAVVGLIILFAARNLPYQIILFLAVTMLISWYYLRWLNEKDHQAIDIHLRSDGLYSAYDPFPYAARTAGGARPNGWANEIGQPIPKNLRGDSKAIRMENGENDEDRAALVEIIPQLCFLRPNLCLHKDGSLSAFFKYTGPDTDALSPAKRAELSRILKDSMKRAGGNFSIWANTYHFLAADIPTPTAPDPYVAAFLRYRQDRVKASRQFTNEFVFAIVKRPKKTGNNLLDRFAIYMDYAGQSILRALFSAVRDTLFHRKMFAFQSAVVEAQSIEFESMLNDFTSSLADLKMRRLNYEEILGTLNSHLNFAKGPELLGYPQHGLIDYAIGERRIERAKNYLKFYDGGKIYYVGAVTLKSVVNPFIPAMLDRLSTLGHEAIISHSYRVFSKNDSTADIERVFKYVNFTQVPLLKALLRAFNKNDVVEQESTTIKEAKDQIDKAKLEIEQNDILFGFYNLSILIKGNTPEEVDKGIEEAATIINEKRMTAIKESVNVFSSFAGTLPGQFAYQKRLIFLSSANVADLLPISTLDSGQPLSQHLSKEARKPQPSLGVYHTGHNVLFHLNLHVGSNGHTFIVGDSGRGKTTFANSLLLAYQQYAPFCAVFDKDYSCRVTTLMASGRHYTVTPEGSRVNILSVIRTSEGLEWFHGWAVRLLNSKLGAYPVTPEEDTRIREILESLATARQSCLTSFVALLPSRLEAHMLQWVEGGRFPIFDSYEESDLDDWVCFEMNALFKSYKEFMGPFLDAQFFRIEQKISQLNGRPGIIYFPEIWYLLSDPIFAARINEVLLTFRKKNVIVIADTQNFSQLRDSPIYSTFLSTIATKIILPNSNVQSGLIKSVLQDFGVNDHQLALIENGKPFRDYIVINDFTTRVLASTFDKREMTMLTSEKTDNQLLTQLMTEHPKDFRSIYLKTKIGAS
ncbi:MAG: hypothetical protein ING36_02050 [Burkholderiales bacterium]|nr:hypothetical protein [Burkholderiales bacterium]